MGTRGVASLFFELGADATGQYKHEATPLHRASGRGQVDLVRLLVEHGADVTAQKN